MPSRVAPERRTGSVEGQTVSCWVEVTGGVRLSSQWSRDGSQPSPSVEFLPPIRRR